MRRIKDNKSDRVSGSVSPLSGMAGVNGASGGESRKKTVEDHPQPSRGTGAGLGLVLEDSSPVIGVIRSEATLLLFLAAVGFFEQIEPERGRLTVQQEGKWFVFRRKEAA